MTVADVIPFPVEASRRRFASPEQLAASERAEQRKRAETVRAELCYWPRAFRRRLAGWEERLADARHRLPPHGWPTSPRGRPERFVGVYRERAEQLRRAARTLRAARARASKLDTLQRALDESKRRLLALLFEHELRRIDRAELVRWMDADGDPVPDAARRAEWSAAQAKDEAEGIAARLESGVYASGRRRGQPYSADYRAALEARLQAALRKQAEARDVLKRLEGETDPLRSWGLYAARRRPAARESETPHTTEAERCPRR